MDTGSIPDRREYEPDDEESESDAVSLVWPGRPCLARWSLHGAVPWRGGATMTAHEKSKAMLEMILLGSLWTIATPVVDVCSCHECWLLLERVDRQRGVKVVGTYE